jgi:hypothetical protein
MKKIGTRKPNPIASSFPYGVEHRPDQHQRADS